MTMIIHMSVDLDDQFLYDVMTIAVEGGINYWAGCTSVDRTEDLSVTAVYGVYDLEDPAEILPRNYVNKHGIAYALQRIADNKTNLSNGRVAHILRAIRDPEGICLLDAEDCDMIFQIALFDEVVYG